MKDLVEPKDIPWAAQRLARKTLSETQRVLPIQAHMEMASLRGRLYATRGVPSHVRSNIEMILGDLFTSSEIEQIARRYSQFKRRLYLAEILPLLRGFGDPRHNPVQGLGYLDDALTQNRGAILATAHLGYPSLIAPILSAHGYQVKKVISGAGRLVRKRSQDESLAEGSNFRRWIHERTRVYRENASTIPANLDVRPIFDALSRNEAVMIAGEGMRAVEFARVSLLGKIYPLPTGFMKIAMLTEATVLPVFVVEGDRRHQIQLEIHSALQIDPKGDVAGNLQLFADALGLQIKRTPHLWNRWKVKNLLEKVLNGSESDIRHRYEARWKRAPGKHESKASV